MQNKPLSKRSLRSLVVRTVLRRAVVLLGFLAAPAVDPAAAGAPEGPGVAGGPSDARFAPPVPPRPRVISRIPSRLKRKLDLAFEVASLRLEEQPNCRELFRDLSKDGSSALLESLYTVATVAEERTYCDKAAAITTVGARVIRLCRKFSRLPTDSGALVLIHEALHHAGLQESPPYLEGLSSREVNALVGASCGL